MKKEDKKSKKQEPEIDFTNISVDDIAKKFLETKPKPKKKKKEEEK